MRENGVMREAKSVMTRPTSAFGTGFHAIASLLSCRHQLSSASATFQFQFSTPPLRIHFTNCHSQFHTSHFTVRITIIAFDTPSVLPPNTNFQSY